MFHAYELQLLNAFKRLTSHLCHDEKNKISDSLSFLFNEFNLPTVMIII